MEDETTTEAAETATAAGDVEEGKPLEDQEKIPESAEGGKPGEESEQVEGGEGGEKVEAGESGEVSEQGEGGQRVEVGEVVEGGEGGEGGEAGQTDEVEGEHVESEGLEGEHVEGEYIEGEYEEIELVEGELVEGEEKEKVLGEGEELIGEGLEGEQVEGEEAVTGEEDLLPPLPEEAVEEEQAYIEEPPPDPAAPYEFSDSKEALKAPFELRPDQLAEVEQLWEIYQNYTPAYADLDGFITETELVYMLKCLLLMTYTHEQLQELVAYCCKPPHPKGFIFYEQFLKMVMIRQRDFPIEEELRSALQVFDPEKTGTIERDHIKEVLSKQGHKMPHRQLDHLIKEVDMSNDGTIGIEDVVATMCIDLNAEDMQMLRAAVYPPEERQAGDHEDIVEAPEDSDDD